MTLDRIDRLRIELEAAIADARVEDLPRLIALLADSSARAQLRIITISTVVEAVERADMTADQIATMFSVPASQIYEQARQGRIPCVRLGKYVRFCASAVRAALEAPRSSERPHLGTPKKRNKRDALGTPATALQPTRTAKGGAS